MLIRRGAIICNLYSITTNQAAIIALFRVINRYVGNLPPMPGVFPDYPAPVIRNTDTGRELVMMRWGTPPPPRTPGAPVTNIRTPAHRTGAAGKVEAARFPIPCHPVPSDRLLATV
jgi:putative SOS response-associated peptidase YedK